MIFLNGLSLPLLLCAYAFIAAFWITLRSKERRESPDQWSRGGLIAYVSISSLAVLSTIITTVIWSVTHSPIFDKIHFIMLGVLAFVMCIIIGVTTISTLLDLRRFSTKNAELSKVRS